MGASFSGPMTDTEAGELLGALLPADSATSEDQRPRITREAGGSPFVLEQLARYASVDRIGGGARRRRLPRCSIRGSPRCHRMRAGSSRRWQCAPGRWRRKSSARRAASFARGSRCWPRCAPRTSFVAAVRRSRSRRTTIGSAKWWPRKSHRIRGGGIHASWCRPSSTRGSDDCEALFDHYRGAGDVENASIQASLSAVKASAALAFDRAASFYRHALALTPASPSGPRVEGRARRRARQRRPPGRSRTSVRPCSGRGRASTRTSNCSGAAPSSSSLPATSTRASTCFVTFLQGLACVCREARAWGAAVVAVAARTARSGAGCALLQGTPTTSTQIPFFASTPAGRRRRGCCWWTCSARRDFSARHLLMALDAGEPFRIARGMAIESAARTRFRQVERPAGNWPSGRRNSRSAVGHPHAIALSILADGMMAVAAGEWQKDLDAVRGKRWRSCETSAWGSRGN